MKRPLSHSQIVCIIVLWMLLCYLLIAYSERIDGMTVLTIFLSGAFVFVPVYKSLKKKK
ncbi:MAG: hypothetical protein RR365_02585 [Bacteroides sp.]